MPSLPFDAATAVSYGKFVNAAYTMYGADSTNTRPPPSPDFPADYELAAWILMRDFILVVRLEIVVSVCHSFLLIDRAPLEDARSGGH